MAHAAKSTPGLVGYIARCYDEIPAKAIYEMDFGEHREIECKSVVCSREMVWDRSPLFCFVIVPIVPKLRPKYKPPRGTH